MNGWCSNCHTKGELVRYRLAMVGLRWMHETCAERLSALGMVIDPIEGFDERRMNIGPVARVNHGESPDRGSDRRFALRLGWLA